MASKELFDSVPVEMEAINIEPTFRKSSFFETYK